QQLFSHLKTPFLSPISITYTVYFGSLLSNSSLSKKVYLCQTNFATSHKRKEIVSNEQKEFQTKQSN
ncbi:hypothetical protein OFN30_34710, partial [Escherichia coli]|nr:hypothetical protein [Escherichia coli]